MRSMKKKNNSGRRSCKIKNKEEETSEPNEKKASKNKKRVQGWSWKHAEAEKSTGCYFAITRRFFLAPCALSFRENDLCQGKTE